jgi:integrase
MAKHPDFPGVSSFRDRHGRERWRFREGGRTVSLRMGPDDPGFLEAYEAAVSGLPQPSAKPAAPATPMPGAALPRTLRAAWVAYLKRSPEWQGMAQISRDRQRARADAFLMSPVAGPGAGASAAPVWGDMPVADLQRRHVKAILAQRADTPHAAKNLLVVIRKICESAMDEDWIEQDPTYRIRWSPKLKGHQPWPFEDLLAFERCWPTGTPARLAYALALWLGNRRGDVAALRVDQLRDQLADITQQKTGHELTLPIVPMLEEALAAADLSGPTVLKSTRGEAYSGKSLTGRMAAWTKAAGLPPGRTLHGLRKTLGALAADAQATAREGMSILGHRTSSEYENYSAGADRKRLAASGMAKVVNLWEERLKRAG